MDSAGTPSRPAGGARPGDPRPAGGAARGPSASGTPGSTTTPSQQGGSGAGAGSKPSGSGSPAPTKPAPGAKPTTGAPAAKPAPAKPEPTKVVRPTPPSEATGPLSGAATQRTAAAPPPVAPAAPVASPPTGPVRPPVDPRAGSGAAAAPAAAVRPAGPRRARLLLTRVDPWSVMKSAFMLSVSIAIVTLVAVALLWWSLDVTGVFAAIGRTIDDVAGSGSTAFDFLSLVGFSRVMGVALVLAAVEIVLVSALSTLFAFLYNLSVGLTGGLEVTLSEDS